MGSTSFENDEKFQGNYQQQQLEDAERALALGQIQKGLELVQRYRSQQSQQFYKDSASSATSLRLKALEQQLDEQSDELLDKNSVSFRDALLPCANVSLYLDQQASIGKSSVSSGQKDSTFRELVLKRLLQTLQSISLKSSKIKEDQQQQESLTLVALLWPLSSRRLRKFLRNKLPGNIRNKIQERWSLTLLDLTEGKELVEASKPLTFAEKLLNILRDLGVHWPIGMSVMVVIICLLLFLRYTRRH